MICPHCGSGKIYRDGKKKNVQTYRCRTCGKYFSDGVKKKKILVISDTHCGHLWGLTPPHYWTEYNEKAFLFQKEAWTWFQNVISLNKPFDLCIGNGDLIDGRGEKSGGTELITSDRIIQASMAAEILNMTESKDIVISRGTDYHVGNQEQFEQRIFDLTGAREISDRLKLRISGTLIDVRHHVGGTTVPWSELTAPLKELVLANLENNENVNVMIRSHVHRYTKAEIDTNQQVITTPGLQGLSRFGSKRCVGRVHFGIVIIEIDKNGVKIKPILSDLENLKREITEY